MKGVQSAVRSGNSDVRSGNSSVRSGNSSVRCAGSNAKSGSMLLTIIQETGTSLLAEMLSFASDVSSEGTTAC